MMRAIGCLGLVAVLGFLAVEIWFFWLMSGWTSHLVWNENGHDVLTCFFLMAVLMLVGWRLAAWHIRQIPMAFLAGKAGRHFIGALGGVLLVLPGFLTDAVGVLLLLPPIQIGFSALGNRLLGSVARVAMQRMMGGRMPGGMPGMPGFPGGLKPDDILRFPGMQKRGGPKTYDTTVEK
jgi:UPF0716 protein FxsA